MKSRLLFVMLLAVSAFAQQSSPPALPSNLYTTPSFIGGGVPGGSNTQVQFNNNSVFAGDTGLAYTLGTQSLAVGLGGSSFLSVNNSGGASNLPNAGIIRLTGTSSLCWGNSALAGCLSEIGNGASSATFSLTNGALSFQSPSYLTTTNCSSSAAPAVCGSAAAGSVVIAAAATTVQVNTTAVTANSQILLTRDDSLGTKLSVTCNTATVMGEMKVSARTAGTSFTITVQTTPATNPGCISYSIVN